MVQASDNDQPNISLLGVPVQDGTHERGCLMGPDALRTAGIVDTLNDLGFTCTDHGDLAPSVINLAPPHPRQCHQLCQDCRLDTVLVGQSP